MEILARAVGRRKEAVAQVQLLRGTGRFLINDKPADAYLQNNSCAMILIQSPFESVTLETSSSPEATPKATTEATPEAKEQNNIEQKEKFDTIVKVKGGGLIGQAEAIKLAVARAICEMHKTSENSVRKILKDKGYLTQDSRVKERRKYGLKKARKASQYHKR